ncbi:MAG: flippase-like domain-containing protein [Candidatus Aminicenantes bacterium]|nr:MAG: flippase-like domain-containing protein [Candidatus Aminicenantes bacterium]
MPKRKDLRILALKLIFSFSILAFLLIREVRIQDIPQALKEIDIFWLVLSFSLHSLGLLISAYRWQILIRAQGDLVPLGFLAKSYLVGNFFNLFLPTRFGGDVVRIWDGSRYSHSLLKSSAIVIVERFTGVIVLLTFAFVVSLSRLDMAKNLPIIWISLLIGLVGLLTAFLFFTPIATYFLEKIPEKGIWLKLKSKTLEFRRVVLVYKDKKRAFFLALFWAFLLQVNVILHYYLAGKAFHLEIPLLDYFIFIPIILLILTIPVTISGLGLREMLFIQIFSTYSIAEHVSFSFSVIVDFSFTLIIGIIGGIIFITRK